MLLKPVLVCEKCGETLTPEEITAGRSLVCPKCEGAEKASSPKEVAGSRAEDKPAPGPETTGHGSCCCGHGT